MFTSNIEAVPEGRQGTLHHRIKWSACACLAAALLPFSAWAQQPALSLERALELSAQQSRQLVAGDAQVRSARQMAVAAGQLPDPALKLGLNNLPINGPDAFSLTNEFMTMRAIGVMQEFTRSDKRRARAARYETEAELAQAGHAMALASLRRDTALAWLERHYLERTHELLRLQRDEANLQVEGANASYRGGRGTQADVYAARSSLALIDDRLQQLEQQIMTAKMRLVRWIGSAGNQNLAAAPDLNTIGLDPDRLDLQLQSHPAIIVMDKQEALARAEVAIAQSEKQADWSAELMFSQRGPAYSNMVSINFSVPLQVKQGVRQDRELGAKLALLDQVQAQREEASRERVNETQGWLQQWQADRKRLANYDQTLIPLAARRTQAALQAYRNGSPLTTVLEARRQEIDTRLERLRLETEAATLWAQLNFLMPLIQSGQTPNAACA